MQLVNLLFTYFAIVHSSSALPIQEEKSKLSQMTETAKTYIKMASTYCRETLNTASLLFNRVVVEFMAKFKALRDRGEAKIEEHKEDLNELEELTEEKMKELLKEFYNQMEAGKDYKSTEEEASEEEKGQEEEQGQEKGQEKERTEV